MNLEQLLFTVIVIGFASAFSPYKSLYLRAMGRARSFALNMEWSFKEFKTETDGRMKKSLEACLGQMNTIRAGGANPSILDRIQVEYYGTYTPLQQLARVSAQGSQQLIIEPFDKAIIKDIEREISQSDLNLTPTNDGSGIIRISIPPLTEERRKALAKKAKSVGEEGKIAIRNIRRDCVDQVKKLEKESELSKDDCAGAQEEVQKITDGFIKKIDDLVKSKEKDLLTL